VAIKGRAIRADVFSVFAHIAEYVRMVVWRCGADAHEFLCADLDDRNTWIVMEMGNDFVAHALWLTSCSVYRFDFRPHHSGQSWGFLATRCHTWTAGL
jgi:hypothetical protein